MKQSAARELLVCVASVLFMALLCLALVSCRASTGSNFGDSRLRTWKLADGSSFDCGVYGNLPEAYPFRIDCDFIEAVVYFKLSQSGNDAIGWTRMRKDSFTDEDGTDVSWLGTARAPNGLYDVEVRVDRNGASEVLTGLTVTIDDSLGRL